MGSPADRQVTMSDDVERIAAAWNDITADLVRQRHPEHANLAKGWEELAGEARHFSREVVRRLLLKGVIGVGKRPDEGPPPMAGQTRIET